MDKKPIEVILESIAAYLRLREKTEKHWTGADFAKQYNIHTSTLSRVKNRNPYDDYEPTPSTLITLLHAMQKEPPMVAPKDGEVAKAILGQFPGMEDTISIFFQVADVLSARATLDPTLFQMFLMSLQTLHKQALSR